MMMSGALLTEYPDVSTKLYNPPPLPGAFRKVFPVVATGKAPTARKRRLRKNNPLAKHVAVALPVVGGYSRAQPVRLVVARHLGAAHLALRQQAHTTLARREIILSDFAQRIPGKRNAVERRIDVGACCALAENRFCRHEAPRRDGDAFVLDGRRAGLLRALGCRLSGSHRGSQRFVAHLQVAHRGV